mgnify:FL=1
MNNETKCLTHGRASVYNINCHIIGGTKYRNKALKGDVEVALKHILLAVARDYNFQIDHMEIGKDDHVHFLVPAVVMSTKPTGIITCTSIVALISDFEQMMTG